MRPRQFINSRTRVLLHISHLFLNRPVLMLGDKDFENNRQNNGAQEQRDQYLHQSEAF